MNIRSTFLALALIFSGSPAFAACIGPITNGPDLCDGGTSGSNVGIGDTNPSSRLTVNGAASAYDTTSGNQVSNYGDANGAEIEGVNHTTTTTKVPLNFGGYGGAVNIGSSGSATTVKGNLTTLGTISGSGAGLTNLPGVFNVADYGGCGTATDAANLSATFAAARSSAAYINGRPVNVTGGFGPTTPKCNITGSVNATGFTSFGTGSKLLISNLNLNCAGNGLICLDTIGDKNLRFDHVTIKGDPSAPPMIGLQRGNPNPSTIACCIQEDHDLDIEGPFTFAAELNAASESTTEFYPVIRNDGSAGGTALTQGSIYTLSAVSAGSGYSGATGQINNISVSGSATGTGGLVSANVGLGGSLTGLVATTQGKQYKVGDVLSPVPGTGSGSSGSLGNYTTLPTFTVTAVQQFGLVMDGVNHWGLTSSFQAISWPADTYYTFTENNVFGGSVRFYGANGAAIWTNGMVGFKMRDVYVLSEGQTCVNLFDNGTLQTHLPNGAANAFATFDIECEASTSADFLLTGITANPKLPGFQYQTPQETASASIFALDAGVTSPSLTRANIDIGQNGSPIPLSTGSLASWTITGSVIGATDNGVSSTNTALCGSIAGSAGCMKQLVNGVLHWTPYF